VAELERRVESKEQEIQKMEIMFREYSNWRSKLE